MSRDDNLPDLRKYEVNKWLGEAPGWKQCLVCVDVSCLCEKPVFWLMLGEDLGSLRNPALAIQIKRARQSPEGEIVTLLCTPAAARNARAKLREKKRILQTAAINNRRVTIG